MTRRALAGTFGWCTVVVSAMVAGIGMDQHDAITSWLGMMGIILGAVIIAEADGE